MEIKKDLPVIKKVLRKKLEINKKFIEVKKIIPENLIPFPKLIFLCFLINLVLIFLIFLFLKKLPPQIPLFYGLPDGEEQLAPSWTLILPNSTALGIIIINSLFSYLSKNLFIKKGLIIAALIVTFFTSITTLKIAFLVGSF